MAFRLTSTILKLLLIVILIVINLAGTQQISFGTLNTGKVSVDRSRNVDVLSSVEQLAKGIQENVFLKALLEKSLARTTGQFVKSLNLTDGGDKRQSLVNFLVSLLPGTHNNKDGVLYTFPATTDLGQEEVRLVNPVEDSVHGFEFVDSKGSRLEMFDDVLEGPGEASVTVPGGTDYQSETSNALLDTVLDEDDDLDSIIAQSLADDTGDEDSDDIHLISLGDRIGEARKNFDAEKFEDISLMSNIIRQIISDDSEIGDSDEIHVFTQDDTETATLNRMNAASLNNIHLEILNNISKTSLNEINMVDLDDNKARLNAFSANDPTIYVGTWDAINALDEMNMGTPNDIYVGASNGINGPPQRDVNMPTTRDINVQIPNEQTVHKQSLGVFAHDVKPSEILLKLPEKLATLLQPDKISEIAQYLLSEVNAYKSLVKPEGAENFVYPQGDNSWLSNENLLQLLRQRPKMSLELKAEEQMQPKIKSTESFPSYYHDPYYESEDNLPYTNQNSGLQIDSTYLDELNPGVYLTDYLKEQLHWPQLVKAGVQSRNSPHLMEKSQLLDSVPRSPEVNSVVRSPLMEKSREIQSRLELIPLKEREYIQDKTDALLHEYKDKVKGGLLQVLYKQFHQPDKTYNRMMTSQNYDIVTPVKTNSTKIRADDRETKSIDQIVFNMLKIDDLPDTKQNAPKLGFRNNNFIASKDQQVQEQFIATTNSVTLGSPNYLNVKVDEFDANKAPRRSKRSKEWPQSDAGSVNHKFRNKKLFLTQQFQIMRHEKSQETRQMAGVDSKMNQILPWGISVQSEVQDLYEADRHVPPLLSRDHEVDNTASVIPGDKDNTASVISEDNEANLSRADVIQTAILNRPNSDLVINSAQLNKDIYRTSTVNLSSPTEEINLNNTFTNEPKLVPTENRGMEDNYSNVISKRNFIDYLQNETRNNETALGNNSVINNNITFLNSSVVKGNASNLMENGTTTNIISRRGLSGWNDTSGNISQVIEQVLELNASVAFTNVSSKRNNNESGLIGGNDQGGRVKRDVPNVQFTSRGGSNVEHVPSWTFHDTTKPTAQVRPDLRKQPTTTIRPEQATPPSTLTRPQQLPSASKSDTLKNTNVAVQDQYGSGYSNSKAKADTSRQFRPTNFPSSFGENNQIENTVDTQTRPPDTQGSTESYITRYLREKENAEKFGRKRDLSSNSPTINKNQGSNRNYDTNPDEHRRKGISNPAPYYESKSNYPDRGFKSGSTYADRFLQSKNPLQPTARPFNTKQTGDSGRDSYKLNAQNDRDGNDQRDSYKLTAHNDRDGNNQRDSYKLTSHNDRDGNDQRDSYKLTAHNDRDGNNQRDSYKLTSHNDRDGNNQRDSYKLTSHNDKDDNDQRDSYKLTSHNDRDGNDQRDSYKLTTQNDKDDNDQRDSYKLTSHNDRDGNDQRDSYKLTSHNDRDGNDQRDSYKLTSHNDRDGNDQRDSYKLTSHNDRDGNDQRDSYKLTSHNDRDGNDQRDSYKLTAQNDRDGNDQLDSYKLTAQGDWDGSYTHESQPEQQVSSTVLDGVQIQDLASESGDLLHMIPPEPMVVHYQPVITYYTPPIHYSQIPEYMDFTAKLFTPTDPGQWDTSMTDPNQDQHVSTVNEPKPDQGISIKNDPGADQGWSDDVQIDSTIYDSNTDQQMTVNKQHTNQRTDQWSSSNDQIMYDDVQSNNWGKDSYYTNDYQNKKTGSGNYNQKQHFRKQSQRVNKNRKFSNPTNYGQDNMRNQNQNKGTFINYSTNQNYKNTNNARPYNTQKTNQYTKQRTSTTTSADDEMDDEAVLQFIYSQKKMNTGQSGTSSSDSQDYSSSSTNYRMQDSTANKGGQTKEDKMIDDIVEHYIYFKPKYGYGQSNNNKMGLL